ncbi:hypothetical protein NQD34_000397 [Periophthalmus magnuspinnatus]|nr:hypothetical protein NQD34_000397 [Periophthalmus magnuspinnatus]
MLLRFPGLLLLLCLVLQSGIDKIECVYNLEQSIAQGVSLLKSYFSIEPCFKVSLVLGNHALVLVTYFSHDGGKVGLRLGVHLHINLSTHLTPHGCHTSSWFFLRKISSSFKPSICISRSDLHKVSSSSILFRPAMSASTDWRMASSFSYLRNCRNS